MNGVSDRLAAAFPKDDHGIRAKLIPLRESLLGNPWFKRLEKPRIGRRDRIPTSKELAALLKDASPAFRLIYTGLSQSGARPMRPPAPARGPAAG